MAKLISVLGAGRYRECSYGFDRAFDYIQEAIIRKHQSEISKVIIFATKKSQELNWLGENYYQNPALKPTLEKMLNKEGFEFEYELVEIPNGYSEEEIWEIFDIFVKQIEEGDNIYLDITHGFRYQPMLVMNILNYVKFLKEISIEKIEYGLYINDTGESKILDLSLLDYLNDWVVAIDSFLTTGNIAKIDQVSKKEINKVLAAFKGQDRFFKSLEKLIYSLKIFESNIRNCRAKDLDKSIKTVLERLDKLEVVIEEGESLKNKRLLPFVELTSRIREKLSYFKEGDREVANYFNALQWCAEHNLVQQGLTIIAENLITIVAEQLNKDYYLKEIREDIRLALVSIFKNISDPDELGVEDQELFKEALDLIKSDYQKLPELFGNIFDTRNDINHFGFKECDSGFKQLENRFDKYIEDVEGILKEVEEKEQDSPNMYLLFSHQLSAEQKKDAQENLAVDKFIYLNDELQKKWSNIPPEIKELAQYLEEIKEWLKDRVKEDDYILIQGDFGASYIMINWAFEQDCIPIYSATQREIISEEKSAEKISSTKVFKHEGYRYYQRA